MRRFFRTTLPQYLRLAGASVARANADGASSTVVEDYAGLVAVLRALQTTPYP